MGIIITANAVTIGVQVTAGELEFFTTKLQLTQQQHIVCEPYLQNITSACQITVCILQEKLRRHAREPKNPHAPIGWGALAVFLGQVSVKAGDKKQQDVEQLLLILDAVFLVIYTIELGLRLFAYRCHAFANAWTA
eukprot:531910-Amphidinium_carterae.1